MFLISFILSITKFLPDQRVDRGWNDAIARSIEHEREKQPDQNHAPKWPIGLAQF
jgi:hypothetical protein